MSLSKQLMLLISLIFLVIFTVNFYTSVSNIRDYLQIESEIHAQDTATSLGLSLSPYILDEDDTILETMINAIFDRGYYLEILLLNRHDKELVKKTNPKSFEQVPQWFTEMLPMETVTVKSEIDAGWVKGGTVFVTIHPGFGYLKLWEQAKESLTYSVISLVFFIGILILILRLVLSPLAKINSLAMSIADGNFDTIKKLPWTRDIRNVAVSMNLMSGKIEKVIKNLNAKLENAGKRLRVDELTGLEMRSTFETEMKQRFMANHKGFIFIIRIDQLGDFASKESSTTVDEFIKGFVKSIRDALSDLSMSGEFLYRIVGAEFVLIADCNDDKAAGQLCEKILANLKKLGEEFDKEEVAHIGGIAFDEHGTTASMISAATEAYEKARLIGSNSFAISQGGENARTADEWKSLVADVIDNQRIAINYAAQAFSLIDGQEQQLLLEEAMAGATDSEGQVLPIGTFISVAENIGKILQFDTDVVKKVIDYIKGESIDHDVAVNLSFTSLASNDFRSDLYKLLQDNQDACQQLVFSVTAYGAAKDINAFASFIDFAHRNGAKVMLKRFESRFISMDEVKQFKLDYIRLARVYTENIGSDSEKRRLVEAMRELGELLDVKVVAEAVESDSDYEAVKEIGLSAASR